MKWKTIEPWRLQELVTSNSPIYVLNTSQFRSGRGSIIISFIDGTRRRQFVVPPTFIPICITDAIPHAEISNPDFLDLLNKRIVTIVDAKQAEEYLKTTEAREEYEAIVLSNHSHKAQGIDLESSVKKSFSSSLSLNTDVEEVVSDVPVTTKVRAFMDDLSAGVITAKEALAECKRHYSTFTELDLQYIKENTKDVNITKWVDNQFIDRSTDAQTLASNKKVSSLSRAINNKKVSKRDDDEPTTAEEEAELARGMARAQSNQLMNGIPSEAFMKIK